MPEFSRVVNWEQIKELSDNEILATGFKNVLKCHKEKIALELQNFLRRSHSSIGELLT